MRPALTAGRRAVVTAKAVTAKSRMINHSRYCWYPCTNIMTDIAFGARLDMAIILTRRSNTIVTA